MVYQETKTFIINNQQTVKAMRHQGGTVTLKTRLIFFHRTSQKTLLITLMMLNRMEWQDSAQVLVILPSQAIHRKRKTHPHCPTLVQSAGRLVFKPLATTWDSWPRETAVTAVLVVLWRTFWRTSPLNTSSPSYWPRRISKDSLWWTLSSLVCKRRHALQRGRNLYSCFFLSYINKNDITNTFLKKKLNFFMIILLLLCHTLSVYVQ